MKTAKILKTIAAVAGGLAMIGATVGAATALDLGDYPQPFIVNGEWQGGKIVLGSTAKVDDTMGAVDVIAGLQAAAVTREPVSTGETTVTVEGGVKVESTGDDLNYGEYLSNAETKIDNNDLPDLLADGKVVDNHYEDTEYDYEQYITLGDAYVTFDRPDSDVTTPEIYLEFEGIQYAYILTVDFKDLLDVTSSASDTHAGLVDGESITMFGKKFTFDTSPSDTEDLTLYGSDIVEIITIGETKTVTVDGQEYEIKVLGGNSDKQTAILSVNGDTETVETGDNANLGGLDLYVDDVFISNIGGDSVSVKLFIGSQELTIPTDARGAWTNVKVDGEELAGYYVYVDGNSSTWRDIDKIQFKVVPEEFDEDIGYSDGLNYLEAGKEFTDPVFGTFKVVFSGAEPELDSDAKDYILLERSGDDLAITFTNKDGDTITFTPYTGDGTNIKWHEDFKTGNATNMQKDDVFIAQEGTGVNRVTKVYEVISISTSDDEVKFKDLGTGTTETVRIGDELGDTGWYIFPAGTCSGTDITTRNFSICNQSTSGSIVTLNTDILTENEMEITLGAPGADVGSSSGNESMIAFEEDAGGRNIDETNEVYKAGFTVIIDTDSDDDIKITSLSSFEKINSSNSIIGSGATTWSDWCADLNGDDTCAATEPKLGHNHTFEFDTSNDDENNVKYGLTEYGTYMQLELDQNGEYFKIWTPSEETDYDVWFAPTTATTTTVSGENYREVVHPLPTGLTVKDVDAPALGSVPLLVIGGPCVNSVAAELMGNPANCAEGFEDGKAIIKLFPDQNALLVAGYSGADTQAACQVLKDYSDYLDEFDGKTEVEVITATKQVTEVTTTQPETGEGGEEGEGGDSSE